ncbi:MAG: biotin/lipoyl-binding protein [Methylobacter sp.]
MSAHTLNPDQSALWQRVADSRPVLHPHIDFHCHYYRGQPWYVAYNPVTRKTVRFSAVAHDLLMLCDGHRTVSVLAEELGRRLGADAPTPEELPRLLKQFNDSDIIVWRDAGALINRRDRLREIKRSPPILTLLKNPLSVRIPLFDPDALLTRTLNRVCPCFSGFGLLFWLLVVGAGVITAVTHWDALTQDVSNHVLAPDNLVIMLLIYPLIKALHEFGHAYAIKYWGGEVHEMGILLLVFMPVPYVEASSAAAFVNKYQRMAVGAAGILVELFIAALALLLWANIEPGALRSALYSTVFISGVTTLLFNGNPLLRFDGYYVFADALEIPNLGARSNQFFGYCLKKYVLGLAATPRPRTYPGEIKWLLSYGVAAFIYRLFVVAAIILFIAGEYFFIGIVLALWAVFGMIIAPLFIKARQLKQELTQAGADRASYRTVAVLVGLVLVFCVVPVPHRISSEGVIWLDEFAQVRSETDGEIKMIAAKPGAEVKQGDILFELDDPLLTAKRDIARYRLEELNAQYAQLWRTDIPQALIVKDSIATAAADVRELEQRLAHLQVKSRADGRFIVPNSEDLSGRFFRQGSLLAYVSPLPVLSVRVVVEQRDIALVRAQTKQVQIRLASALAEVFTAELLREVPGASKDLPSRALSRAGGGQIAPDPEEPSGRRAFETVFQLDLRLPNTVPALFIGERVYVLFYLTPEPIVMQLYRQLRNVLLAKFDI